VAVVTVPVQPILDWWRLRTTEHQYRGCVCVTGGYCASVESLARRIGVSHSTIFRRIRGNNIPVAEADQWAIRAGVHPVAIWNDWDKLTVCYDYLCDDDDKAAAT
jgi:transcriptional regulator with XRE-family HTH domain